MGQRGWGSGSEAAGAGQRGSGGGAAGAGQRERGSCTAALLHGCTAARLHGCSLTCLASGGGRSVSEVWMGCAEKRNMPAASSAVSAIKLNRFALSSAVQRI